MRCPKTGRLWGEGGNAGEWGGFGGYDEDGNFLPDGAITIGPEPTTLTLAIEGALGMLGGRVRPHCPAKPLHPYHDPESIWHGHPSAKPTSGPSPIPSQRPVDPFDPGHALWDDALGSGSSGIPSGTTVPWP